MTEPQLTRPVRRRILAALATATVAVLGLSGCALYEEIVERARPGGVTESGQEQLELVDPALPTELREFYEQELDWQACDADLLAPEGYQCATVTAPMDWEAPGDHEPIELALVKRPADGASRGALFTNPGGPGVSGVDFVAGSSDFFFSKSLREQYDIVGWDPRGVGRSSAVECRDDAGMDDFLYGVPDGAATMSEEELAAWHIAETQRFAKDCAESTGPLLGFVDTASTVRDLDMLRAIVGDTRLAYFGLSYGTDIGAQYIDAYPERVGRIVLDGATDPTVPRFDVIIDQREKFADATRSYLADCFTSAECPYTATDVDGGIAEIKAVMDEADETLPKNVDGRVLTSSVISTAITATMYDSGSWQYLSMAFANWYADADPQLFFLLSDSYFGRDIEGHYDSNLFEAFPAIECLDSPLVTDEAEIRRFNERLAEVSPFYEPTELDMTIGDVTCESWQVESRAEQRGPVVGAGAAPVLVVATTNDPATPLKWARAVADQLESAVLIEFEGEGHIAYGQGDACVVGAVDEYLLKGTVPADPTHC